MDNYEGIFTPDELGEVLPLVHGRYDHLLVESSYLGVDEKSFRKMSDAQKEKLKAGINFKERLREMEDFLAYGLSSTLRDREHSDLTEADFPFGEAHSPTFEPSDLHRELHRAERERFLRLRD